MRIQNAVALLPAQLDGGIEDFAGKAVTAALVADRQSFELGEIGKIANPHAADRLAVLVADQMGRGKIIAVEFLFERAMLFAHIDRAADRDHARHLVHRADDFDGDRIAAGTVFTARQILASDRTSADAGRTILVARAGMEAERLQHPQAALGDRTRIDVDALVERRGDFLQHQRNRRGDRALGVDRPDIDAGGPLRLPRDEGDVGVAAYRDGRRSAGACPHDSAAAPQGNPPLLVRQYRSGLCARSPRTYPGYGWRRPERSRWWSGQGCPRARASISEAMPPASTVKITVRLASCSMVILSSERVGPARGTFPGGFPDKIEVKRGHRSSPWL